MHHAVVKVRIIQHWMILFNTIMLMPEPYPRRTVTQNSNNWDVQTANTNRKRESEPYAARRLEGITALTIQVCDESWNDVRRKCYGPLGSSPESSVMFHNACRIF
jgi:hypothetical protein